MDGQERIRAIALLSGGLDSLLASRIVLDLGIDVIGLHFTSPMCNAVKDDDGNRALRAGRELGIRVIVKDKGEEYVDVIRNPRHGYGKNMNPCIDCRIYMLRLTRQAMRAEGASFIITGEVVGQRPMSQRRETIRMIEKESGLDGLILRPLSAKLLPATDAERQGIVAREKLLSVSGRSRRRQYELVEQYGLKQFSCPAGGCLLTDPIYAGKLRDFFDHETDYGVRDIGLLRIGRHFRFADRRFVLGRNQEENEYLEACRLPDYALFRPYGFKGPSGVAKGEPNEKMLQFVAALLQSYGKNPGSPVAFDVVNGHTMRCTVGAMGIDVDQYRIKENS